jgi:hypothetical protein
MILKEAGHNPCVAQESAVGVLDRPTRKAILRIRRAIPIELRIALGLVDRTALIGHHLRIGMHLSERRAMLVAPRAKLQPLRSDH